MNFKILIDKERCKGCELCVSACTHVVLKMADGLNSKGYHFAKIQEPEACTGCQQCAQMCPDAAIEIEGDDD